MDNNQNRLAEAWRRDPALVRRVMNSPDGQALLRQLNRGGDGLPQAVRAAAQGDTGELVRRLQQLAREPDGAALIARIRNAVEQ